MKGKTREEELSSIPLQVSNEENWPNHIRSLGVDELANLGIDKNGRVYWSGKLVTIQKTITLSRFQKVGAFVVGIAAVAASLASVFIAYLQYENSNCEIILLGIECVERRGE